MRWPVAALLLLGCVTRASALDRPHVYLIVVDGLDARFATAARMPRLFELTTRDPERTSTFLDARAVMPTRTDPNHVSLLTGTYPEAHGITGNSYWSRTPDALPARLDAAELIAVETLFTVAETTEPSLVTLGVFSKPKLARLFGAVPERQRAPDVLWSADLASPAGRDRITGYSFDYETMAALLALMASAEPDLTVVTLSDVDRTAHGRGPYSDDCERAVAGADAAIGRLVDHLRALGRWEHSVLIVTADHGFTALAPTPARPYPVITFGRDLLRAHVSGVHLVADGGVEHVYADAISAEATAIGAEVEPILTSVAALALDTAGVSEVLARLPVGGVTEIGSAHPDWHLGHERTGDLLLVAAPGYEFVDPFDPVDAGLLGNHGGPAERAVPLVVSGGYSGLRHAPPGTPAPVLVDVAPTIATLLGLRLPRRLDGGPLAAELVGHPFVAVLSDAQSPH